MIDLPPLPAPKLRLVGFSASDGETDPPCFTGAQMRSYGEACARAALEAAAKACDDYETFSWGEFGAAEGCAAAIRALITKA